MFLDVLMRRNSKFLSAIQMLHQHGSLPTNSYALDLDAIETNSSLLFNAGQIHGLEVIAMTKQIGRNPNACSAIKAGGIRAAVAVDLECAIYSTINGLPISHIGHLVQIPKAQIAEAMKLKPKTWTVFSLEQARWISDNAKRSNETQDISLRVWDEACIFYKGHEGGFHVSEALKMTAEIERLPNLKVAGVTSFPALLFNKEQRSLQVTENAKLITRVAESVEKLLGRSVIRNMPGTTSVGAMELLSDAGATQVEPGHGLTGTTPISSFEDTPEIPAVAYVTEVSHHHNGRAYVFGGGLYRDPVLGEVTTKALVLTHSGDFQTYVADMPPAGSIDYYAALEANGMDLLPPIGSTVIFGFRPQVFVTRGLTVGISDVQGNPKSHRAYGASGAATLVAEGLYS